MDKITQYEKTMRYYKILLNTVNKNKKEKKYLTGNKLFGLSTKPVYVGISNFVLTVGLSVVFTVLAKLPVYYSLPAGAAGSITASVVMPLAIRQLFFHSKSKIGRGYAKMELDTYFTSIKDYIKEYMKNLANSESYEDVSEEDLENFAFVFNNITQNYKTALDKYVGKKIYTKTQKDYKRIQHLLNLEKNQEKNKIKVEKIIKRSEKVLSPWCELYNACGKTAKNLYNGAHDLDASVEMLPDNKFEADSHLLRKMVERYVATKAAAKEVKKGVALADKKSAQKISKNQRAREIERTFEDDNDKTMIF